MAIALVANGVPAFAYMMPVSTGTHEQMAMATQSMDDATVDIAVGDTADGCCMDCTPTAAKPTTCFAMCVAQLPAVLPAATVAPASMITVFEEAALITIGGRALAPDPFPPRLQA